MDRVYSLWDRLTEDGYQAITDLLESCKWGNAEVQQAKEVVATAQ